MAEKLSHLAKQFDIDEPRRRLQADSLKPIVALFRWGNGAVILNIFALAYLEFKYPPTTHVVTKEVLIALIAGLTLQVGAVIIAAFKGLFAR